MFNYGVESVVIALVTLKKKWENECASSVYSYHYNFFLLAEPRFFFIYNLLKDCIQWPTLNVKSLSIFRQSHTQIRSTAVQPCHWEIFHDGLARVWEKIIQNINMVLLGNRRPD